jgi:hypothetical protein
MFLLNTVDYKTEILIFIFTLECTSNYRQILITPSAKHNKTHIKKQSEMFRTFTALTWIFQKIQKAYRLLKPKVFFVPRFCSERGISEKGCKTSITVPSYASLIPVLISN